jgi:hypothetical protein
VGFEVVPAQQKIDVTAPPIPDGYMDKKNIERMAELEHGRFCAERLAQGWRYGSENDFQRKINDTLVEWTKLDDGVKGYDREAVRNIPKWLAQAGLVIQKQSAKRTV